MNIKELIEEYKELDNALYDIGAKAVCQHLLKNLEQLDEQKPFKVPQFVAEIIEYYKRQNATLYDAFREKNFNKQYNEWLMNEQDAYDKVARAQLDGYEVEKEPKYTVMVKGVCGYGRYLNKALLSKEYFFASENEVSGYRTKHTRKELEEAGFGWVQEKFQLANLVLEILK